MYDGTADHASHIGRSGLGPWMVARKTGPSPKQNSVVRLEAVGSRGEVIEQWFRVPGRAVLAAGAADWVFDFHGYSRHEAFLAHVWKRSRTLWPGWDATLVAFPRDLLISEANPVMS